MPACKLRIRSGVPRRHLVPIGGCAPDSGEPALPRNPSVSHAAPAALIVVSPALADPHVWEALRMHSAAAVVIRGATPASDSSRGGSRSRGCPGPSDRRLRSGGRQSCCAAGRTLNPVRDSNRRSLRATTRNPGTMVPIRRRPVAHMGRRLADPNPRQSAARRISLHPSRAPGRRRAWPYPRWWRG